MDTRARGWTRNPWVVAVIAGMASYIDSAAIISSGTALVLYQDPLGLSGAQIGAASAALTLSIAIGALVGGRLGDRLGRRSVFIATMILIVIGAALLVFGGGFTTVLVGSTIVGLGTGADLPVSLATIAEAASDTHRGALVGFTQIMWYFGIVTATALSAVVGTSGYFGGQVLFAHVGLVAALVLLLRLLLPESESWRLAQTERLNGVTTLRAQRTSLRDIVSQRVYLVPFLSLLGFYALTNLGANTSGQFGTYIAVNVAGLDVRTNSLVALVSLPFALGFAIWFLRVVDGPHRMRFFLLGGIFMGASALVPAAFGFSLTTIIIQNALGLFGFAFAFEGIMKVWTQEAFPTLLRSSAQGAIIAVARVAAAALALVTPALLAQPRLMYALIAAVMVAGVLVGWLGFRNQRLNTFEVEFKDLALARRQLREAGILTAAEEPEAPAGPTTRP